MPTFREFRRGITITVDLALPGHLRLLGQGDDMLRAVGVASRDAGLMGLCKSLALAIDNGETVLRATLAVESGTTLDDIVSIQNRVVNAIIAELAPELLVPPVVVKRAS